MGDFSWNLEEDGATVPGPRQRNQQSAARGPIVPEELLSEVPLSETPRSEMPRSRRELRHRAQAGPAPLAADVSTTAGTSVPVPGSRRAARAERAAAAVEIASVTESLMPETSAQAESRSASTSSRSTSSKLPESKPTSGTPARTRGLRRGAPRGRSALTRRRGGLSRRRTLFSKLFSISAMIGVGALMVSTSLPANAFYNAADAAGVPTKSFTSHAQSLQVASAAAEVPATHDTYTVSSLVEQIQLKYGNRNFNYTNDINGTIQWPFPVPVPISSGFGPRIAPCGGCSSFHEGVDFTPGRGVAIGAIADGVVSAVVNSHSGYGNHVIVDHVINGQKIQSLYGHMLDGSITVTVGEQVKVTQTLGLVGSTGESTGAHLHLEIHINGVPVDPFAWLKANAN
ncbi:MAG: M23 family metallopeptidase [Lacisediminihabitans sp.]